MSEEAVVTKAPTALVNLAKEYSAADKVVEQLDEKLKEAKRVLAAAEKRLVDQMVTEGMKAFRTDGIGGFRTQVMVYPNVTDRELLNSYVKKKKLSWLFTVSIHGTKLRSYVKELMENGKPVPPGIEPYMATEIRRFK